MSDQHSIFEILDHLNYVFFSEQGCLVANLLDVPYSRFYVNLNLTGSI